ncbi:MAG TPA: hypothetical protein VK573_08380 [Gemmatimonadales bacterium]|nr:hypothetical protein [Gemmatimonadales bacterium]
MRYDPDRAALVLAQAAQKGLSAPPAWDGDRISTPTYTPEGGYLGRVLPGRGFALATDLRAFGITRPIPGVYERSAVDRMRERWDRWMPRIDPQDHARAYTHRGVHRLLLDSERAAIELLSVSPTVLAARSLAAAITTYDGIINARANGQANDVVYSKTTLTTVAQAFSTLFRAAGLPTVGTYTAIPGGAVHTRASVGAWNGLVDPGGTDKKYLLTVGYGSTASIDWGILVDLLVGCGNIVPTVTTAITVNSVAQTRQYGSTLGAGVMATLDVTTALGTGAGLFTLDSYTNQAGTAAKVSKTADSIASSIVHRLQPGGVVTGLSAPPWIALADGDYGVRSVQAGIRWSVAHSAGAVALNLVFPLAYVPGLAANIYLERDSTTQIDGLTELVNASQVIGCLVWYVQTNSTTSGAFRAFARSCAG